MRWILISLFFLLASWSVQGGELPAEPACCCESMQHCGMMDEAGDMAHACCDQAGCHCDTQCISPHVSPVLLVGSVVVMPERQAIVVSRAFQNFLPSPFLKTPAKPPRF